MTVTATASKQAGGAALLHGTASAARLHLVILIGIAALLSVAPLVVYPVFLMQILCFALFACAFNLLLGYGGLLSFGHAAFFGGAAYVSAYLARHWHAPPEVAILSGTAAAAALGLVFGALAIRRQGIYFAMITLALAQMLYFFCIQTRYTGGEDGIQAVPRGHLFGFIDLSSDTTFAYVVAVIFMAGLLAIYRIVHSPFGQVLKAIRDNEPRAISLGYKTARYKLMVFVLSAALAGLAGSTKAIVFQLASLTDVHWMMSGEVILMTLVGGMGTIFGPITGAMVIVSMQYYLGKIGTIVLTVPGLALTLTLNLGEWITILQGVIFVACVILFRDGLVGLIAKKIKQPL